MGELQLSGGQEILIGVGFTLVVSFITWVKADSRSKERLVYVEEKLSALQEEQAHALKNAVQRVILVEGKLTRSEQDRDEIHKAIERLDNLKASKEIVDAFKNELYMFRSEMDRRFDTIERMLSKS